MHDIVLVCLYVDKNHLNYLKTNVMTVNSIDGSFFSKDQWFISSQKSVMFRNIKYANKITMEFFLNIRELFFLILNQMFP